MRTMGIADGTIIPTIIVIHITSIAVKSPAVHGSPLIPAMLRACHSIHPARHVDEIDPREQSDGPEGAENDDPVSQQE